MKYSFGPNEVIVQLEKEKKTRMEKKASELPSPVSKAAENALFGAGAGVVTGLGIGALGGLRGKQLLSSAKQDALWSGVGAGTFSLAKELAAKRATTPNATTFQNHQESIRRDL